jgi:hypothetical protein
MKVNRLFRLLAATCIAAGTITIIAALMAMAVYQLQRSAPTWPARSLISFFCNLGWSVALISVGMSYFDSPGHRAASRVAAGLAFLLALMLYEVLRIISLRQNTDDAYVLITAGVGWLLFWSGLSKYAAKTHSREPDPSPTHARRM